MPALLQTRPAPPWAPCLRALRPASPVHCSNVASIQKIASYSCVCSIHEAHARSIPSAPIVSIQAIAYRQGCSTYWHASFCRSASPKCRRIAACTSTNTRCCPMAARFAGPTAKYARALQWCPVTIGRYRPRPCSIAYHKAGLLSQENNSEKGAGIHTGMHWLAAQGGRGTCAWLPALPRKHAALP